MMPTAKPTPAPTREARQRALPADMPWPTAPEDRAPGRTARAADRAAERAHRDRGIRIGALVHRGDVLALRPVQHLEIGRLALVGEGHVFLLAVAQPLLTTATSSSIVTPFGILRVAIGCILLVRVPCVVRARSALEPPAGPASLVPVPDPLRSSDARILSCPFLPMLPALQDRRERIEHARDRGRD